jgi:hypothetical protein
MEVVSKPHAPWVLPANSPTGCSAKNHDYGSGLRARQGAPFAVTHDEPVLNHPWGFPD